MGPVPVASFVELKSFDYRACRCRSVRIFDFSQAREMVMLNPHLRPHIEEVARQLRAEWRKRGSRDIPLFGDRQSGCAVRHSASVR